MADPPRLTKLGAKWVEVRTRREEGFRSGIQRAYFENGQQQPLMNAHVSLAGLPDDLSKLLLFQKGAAGVGQPSNHEMPAPTGA